MAAVRSCRVSVRDAEGVTHTVDVTAATLYEAAAQAVADFEKKLGQRRRSRQQPFWRLKCVYRRSVTPYPWLRSRMDRLADDEPA